MPQDRLINASFEYRIQNRGKETITPQNRGDFCEEESQVFRVDGLYFPVIGRTNLFWKCNVLEWRTCVIPERLFPENQEDVP